MSEHDDEIRGKAVKFAEARADWTAADKTVGEAMRRRELASQAVIAASAELAKTVGANIPERFILVAGHGIVHIKYKPVPHIPGGEPKGPLSKDGAEVRLVEAL